jgi:hypothetical protein
MRKGIIRRLGRKLSAALLVPAMLAVSAVPARAENSVSCVYLVLRLYHAQMQACRQPLKPPNERGYVRIRAMMEKFIRENAKANPDGILASVEAKAKAVPRSTCKGPEFAQVKSAMESFTSPYGETQLRENLKRKRDPQAGTCG